MMSHEKGRGRSRGWVLVWLAGATALGACRPDPDRWEDVQLDVEERKRDALAHYLGDPGSIGRLTDDGILVVVHQDLLRRAVQALLPVRRTWGLLDMRLDSAHADFDQGLALVELRGAITLDPSRPSWSELTLLGIVEITGLDPGQERLSSRFTVLGTHVHRVGSEGVPRPLLRALDDVGDVIARDLGTLLRDVAIPVRLTPVHLPGVQADEVTIGPATLPVALSVREVHVLSERLWVSLATHVGDESTPPNASGGGP